MQQQSQDNSRLYTQQPNDILGSSENFQQEQKLLDTRLAAQGLYESKIGQNEVIMIDPSYKNQFFGRLPTQDAQNNEIQFANHFKKMKKGLQQSLDTVKELNTQSLNSYMQQFIGQTDEQLTQSEDQRLKVIEALTLYQQKDYRDQSISLQVFRDILDQIENKHLLSYMTMNDLSYDDVLSYQYEFVMQQFKNYSMLIKELVYKETPQNFGKADSALKQISKLKIQQNRLKASYDRQLLKVFDEDTRKQLQETYTMQSQIILEKQKLVKSTQQLNTIRRIKKRPNAISVKSQSRQRYILYSDELPSKKVKINENVQRVQFDQEQDPEIPMNIEPLDEEEEESKRNDDPYQDQEGLQESKIQQQYDQIQNYEETKQNTADEDVQQDRTLRGRSMSSVKRDISQKTRAISKSALRTSKNSQMNVKGIQSLESQNYQKQIANIKSQISKYERLMKNETSELKIINYKNLISSLIRQQVELEDQN